VFLAKLFCLGVKVGRQVVYFLAIDIGVRIAYLTIVREAVHAMEAYCVWRAA
jgi:hypothetical protein